MEISSSTLVTALLAGVVFFVVTLLIIRALSKEKRLVNRRKTTSLHMAQVVNATVDEKRGEPATGVSVIKKTEAEPSPESVDDSFAADIDGEPADDVDGDIADDTANELAGDSAYDSVDDSADEPAGEDAPSDDKSGDKYADDAENAPTAASDAKPVDTLGRGFAAASADDPEEETRETQAVSLADVMASDESEDKPVVSPQKPPEKIKSVESIHMQPIKPLRTLLQADERADGKPKSAGANINRRRLPETVKMKERKVLLAEDVKVNRELIGMFFEGSGVKFEFAENGRDACEKFEENPGNYSLILMDIQMPVMDGYDAAQAIRAVDTDWAKQIPIIAMTADTTEEAINKCFEAGMDYHVAKPVDMELLQEKVFEFITRDSE